MGDNEVRKARLLTERLTRGKTNSNARAIDRLVNKPEFEEAWLHASDSEITRVISLTKKEEIAQWVIDNTPTCYEDMSYRKLRTVARDNNIFRWSRLTHQELLEKLNERIVQSGGSTSQNS